MMIYNIIKLNLRKKRCLFFFWYQERKHVKKWLLCWVLSTSLTIEILKKILPYRFINEKFNIKIIIDKKVSLNFRIDQLPDLHSFIKTYDNYITHFNIDFKENDIVLDLGAHIGTFSIPLIMENPHIKIYGYEPDEKNFKQLLGNLTINNISTKQCEIYKIAVYDEEKELKFTTGKTSTTGSVESANFYKAVKNAKTVTCKATTLEKIFLVNNIQHCKLLKIDCEGSEYGIFKKVDRGLFKKIDNIIVEAHPTDRYQPELIKKILEEAGYTVTGQMHQNGCYDFFGTRLEY